MALMLQPKRKAMLLKTRSVPLELLSYIVPPEWIGRHRQMPKIAICGLCGFPHGRAETCGNANVAASAAQQRAILALLHLTRMPRLAYISVERNADEFRIIARWVGVRGEGEDDTDRNLDYPVNLPSARPLGQI